MIYMLFRHKVADYDKWKTFFDEHVQFRKDSGLMGGKLFKSALDANELFIIMKIESIEQGRRFVESDNLKEVMKDAGVIDKPDVYFLEKIEEFEQ